MEILALNYKEHVPKELRPYKSISVTSKGTDKWKHLSPFFMGPVTGILGRAKNVENYWQFSKVYPKFWDDDAKTPTPEFFTWRQKGFDSSFAHRYPMGKGKQPLGSWIDGLGLKDYVTSRKMLYIPAYTEALKRSTVYQELLDETKRLWQKGENLVLWEFDVFNYEKKGLTLNEVLNDPQYKYGHAFILKSLLEDYIKNSLEG